MMNVPDILGKISDYKALEVAALKSRTSIDALRDIGNSREAPIGFTASLLKHAEHGAALITEVKKASPSKGVIREDFNPVEISEAYYRGGAACLSVLTDGPGFQGSNEIFKQVRDTSELPLLRKDFMLEPIQIAESRAMGADAVLVILAMINDHAASALMDEAQALGMDVLVETHDATEMKRAADLGAKLIGINNRDLRTFHTTLETFHTLAPQAPTDAVLIAESGIFTPDDIRALAGSGAHGYLIGESLMRKEDIETETLFLKNAINPSH